jgi:hypothetical protein
MVKQLTKKEIDKRRQDNDDLKKAALDKAWARGSKTAMETDILAAGRQKSDKPKDEL